MIDKTKFTELLDNGYSNEQLASYFNKGVSPIKRFKKSNNLIGYKTNLKPLAKEQLLEVISLVEKGYTLKNIENQTGITQYRLRKYVPAQTYALMLNNGHEHFVKNLIKADISNIFIANERSAYICGVLQSDGFLTSDGYIGLTVKDKDFADDFARFFKTKSRQVLSNNIEYFSCRFKDIRNLEKFKEVTGIHPQKTYTEYKIPTWISTNDSFMREFIIGVFNGDGCVYKVPERNTCELSIEQHRYNRGMLEHINNILGWNLYTFGDYVKISTKAADKVKSFYDMFSNSENAMLRKVIVLDQLYL